MDALLDVKERLSIFENLYDVIRLVNPMSNKVINHECEKLNCKSGFCYDVWKKGKKCENCISELALKKNETTIKLEYNQGKIVLVIASPLIINNVTYVVEMVKDVSNNGIVSNNEKNYEESVLGFIDSVKENTNRDELTGVYNKRYINYRLPKDLQTGFEKNVNLSLLMIDLDFFKDINDTYGHLVGDKVLKSFATIVKEYIRKDSMDWIGRYGGEEFVLILNDANEEVAKNIAEAIIKRISSNVFQYEDIKIHLTCSIGIYTHKGLKITMDEAIDKADKNLYKAKESGRNRVILS